MSVFGYFGMDFVADWVIVIVVVRNGKHGPCWTICFRDFYHYQNILISLLNTFFIISLSYILNIFHFILNFVLFASCIFIYLSLIMMT